MLRWSVLLALLGNMFAAFWFYSLQEFRAMPGSSPAAVVVAPGILLLREISDIESRGISRCLLRGRFSGIQQAREIQRALKEAGVVATIVAEDISDGTDYWVYIPVDNMTGDPGRIIRELKANKLDSYVFGEGELEGAVSIGVFSLIGEAEQQVQRLERLGYAGHILDMPRLIRQYWLGLNEQEQGKIADFDWGGGLEAEITLRKVEMPCERVASPP